MPKVTKRTTYTTENTILSRQGAWQAVTVIVSAADVAAGADGRKVVPLGTLLGPVGDEHTIMGGGAKAKPVNGATTEGLAMNTVDVTGGDTEVAMLYMGTVGLDRIPAAPVAAAQAALTRIAFTAD